MTSTVDFEAFYEEEFERARALLRREMPSMSDEEIEKRARELVALWTELPNASN